MLGARAPQAVRTRQLARAPLAAEAVRRIDAIFDAERSINGLPAEQRLAFRQQHVAPLVAELDDLDASRPRQAVAPCRRRQGDGLHAQALDDVHAASSTMAASASRTTPRNARCAAWHSDASRGCLPASDRGGERAAAMYSLIVTAKLNDVDPRAWLADVLARIADHPAPASHELLPWNWAQENAAREPLAA